MKYGIILGLLSLIILVAACQSEQQLDFKRYYSAGALVYQTRCQGCHGSQGEGLAALIPPLNDSVYLRKQLHQLPCYLQTGLKGKLNIAGRLFDEKMPPNTISPMEMAQVLTYITNSFGNDLGTVSIEQVQQDLKTCK